MPDETLKPDNRIGTIQLDTMDANMKRYFKVVRKTQYAAEFCSALGLARCWVTLIITIANTYKSGFIGPTIYSAEGGRTVIKPPNTTAIGVASVLGTTSISLEVLGIIYMVRGKRSLKQAEQYVY